jgi:hypothetical protein
VRQPVAIATSVLLTALVVTAGRAAYDARPPLAHTGGFGEPSCRECHFDGPAPPPEMLSLGGVPERYQAGVVYPLEIAILDTTARVGGFQLSARVSAGPHAGTQAGALCALGARVVVVADTATGVQYASHSGAAPADSLRWRVEWRAPTDDVGAVIFHVAANSANDDDSMLGDVIMLGSWSTGSQGTRTRSQGMSGNGCEERSSRSLPRPTP